MKSEGNVEGGREVFNLAKVVDTAAQSWSDRVAIYHYESGRKTTLKQSD